jgi:hypothetical protein
MANTSWVDLMHSLPDGLLTPAEKGQVCYHVIVEETVAEQKLQRAAEALCNRQPPQRGPNFSEQKAIASLFKWVLAAAGMCHTVDTQFNFFTAQFWHWTTCMHMLDRLTFSNAWSGSSWRDSASASGTESQPSLNPTGTLKERK